MVHGIVFRYRFGHNRTFSKPNGATGMAGGFARDGAVQDQIDATVEDAVKRARSRMHRGEGTRDCTECGNRIPEARREAQPGARLCISCQERDDRRQTADTGYNRRGSKDSQLR